METPPFSSSPERPEPESVDAALTRRGFLRKSCTCALVASAAAPGVRAAWGDPIDIGALTGYASDEISEKFLPQNFFVIRHNGRLYATTATCPHENNALFRSTSNPGEIECSGHQSIFDAEGKPLSGRVDQGLVRFGIAVDDQGRVRVDLNKQFPEDQWEDPASYVALKPAAS